MGDPKVTGLKISATKTKELPKKVLDISENETHTSAVTHKLLAGVLKTFTIFVGVFFCAIKANAAWFSGSGPDYSQGASNTYYCANPSGSPVTSQAGVSISSPTLSLYNPLTSKKNLVILDVGIDITASPAAASGIFLAYNVTPSSGSNSTGYTLTNPIVTSAQVGKSTGSLTSSLARCQIQGSLPPTPVAFRYLGGVTGASAISGVRLVDETNGKVVVPPGGMISIQATAATAMVAHISWREDPTN